MKKIISFLTNQNIGELWKDYINYVLQNGKWIEDNKILEVPLIILELDNPLETDDIIRTYGRKEFIELYCKKMTSTEVIPELNQSYGRRLYNQDGVNQIEWLINKLKKNQDAKSATISLLLPNDPLKTPCLTTIDVKIREKKIVLTAIFRSQNVMNSPGNIIGLLRLQKEIGKSLNLPVGILRLFVLSPHLYREDIDEAKRIV